MGLGSSVIVLDDFDNNVTPFTIFVVSPSNWEMDSMFEVLFCFVLNIEEKIM